MTEVRYRSARSEDIPSMADLFIDSISDMCSRYNVSADIPPRSALLVGYEHYLSTGVFYLAEVDGQVSAIAGAVIRDHIFYLVDFWARPGQQRKGIGMPLLRMVWTAGKQAGASIFSVHSSGDLTAMAAYMKLGMLPGHEVLYFQGRPQRLPAKPSGYEVAELDRHVAVEIDQEIRGTGREPDHRFWQSTAGFRGRQVIRDGRITGYYYLGRGGFGPAAWKDAQEAEAMMALACTEAAETMPEVKFSVPGINHAALRFAFDHGMRLVASFHFLATAPFGRMEQYISSGPALY